jgi:hypothetical protein
MMTRLGRNVRILGLGALMATALATRVGAQTLNPWQAFIGCWTPTEITEEGILDTGNTVLCFRDASEGVEVSSVVTGEVTSTELLAADGQPRSIPAEDCVGTEAVEFSSDGRRAFTRSEITCESDTRRSSGVMAFVAPTRWVDVRSIEIEGESFAWVQAYSSVNREWYVEHAIQDPAVVGDQAVMTRVRRALASRPIGSEEVEEALSRVDSGAVEMWVAVQPNEFDLDADEILRLVDSGVPESVIDVMVAAAYPDRFVLSLEGSAPTVAEAAPDPRNTRYSIPYRGGFGTYMFNPYYVPVGYRYGVYGYPYYEYDIYRPGYVSYSGYVGSNIVVEPRTPQSQGRMVNGQGYSRNSSNRSAGGGRASSGSSGSSGGSSVSASSTSSGGSASSGSSGSGSSSSGGASSGSSSSGTSTGRTAQPRN